MTIKQVSIYIIKKIHHKTSKIIKNRLLVNKNHFYHKLNKKEKF